MTKNVVELVKQVGSSAAMLTLTPATAESVQEFQKRFRYWWRREGSQRFGHYVRVLEFQGSGRAHFHLAIDCRGDVAEGFNWSHYDACIAWSQQPRQSRGPKPRGILTTNAHLRELWAFLRDSLERYGLGRHELVPVRDAKGFGYYLGSYMSASEFQRKPEHKGIRFVSYSQGFERAVRFSVRTEIDGQSVYLRTGIAWVGERARVWREKLAAYAQKHGCEDLSDVRSLFGQHWAYHHREAIERQQVPSPADRSTVPPAQPHRPPFVLDRSPYRELATVNAAWVKPSGRPAVKIPPWYRCRFGVPD